MDDQPPGPAPSGYLRMLGLAAGGYAVLHHVGSLPGGLGEVGLTRWADWVDLATPSLVLGPAAAALALSGRAGRRTWTAFLLGAVAYAQGHGIHLSANSIHNVDPGRAAHLWDETVGHLVWYSGAAVLLGCHALVLSRFARPGGPAGTGPVGTGPQLLLAPALALGVGLTWWTNALGGGTVWLALPVALALAGFGLRRRRTLAVLLPVGFLPAACLLAASATGILPG